MGLHDQLRIDVTPAKCRVWWFDQQILEALNPSQAGSAAGSTRSTTQLGSSPAIRPVVEKAAVADRRSHQNVVVLGSGMDTRPWRLDLPSGAAEHAYTLLPVAVCHRSSAKRCNGTFALKRIGLGDKHAPRVLQVAQRQKPAANACRWCALQVCTGMRLIRKTC